MPYKDLEQARAYHKAYSAQWSKEHPDRRRIASARWRDLKGNASNRLKRRQIREEVIAHYGGKCACCSESAFEFLAIDHLEGGGKEHRKQLKGTHIEVWLKANQFPKGFRVLCHNCNLAIGFYGKCPHQDRRT